jgi:hypothetical protein
MNATITKIEEHMGLLLNCINRGLGRNTLLFHFKVIQGLVAELKAQTCDPYQPNPLPEAVQDAMDKPVKQEESNGPDLPSE